MSVRAMSLAPESTAAGLAPSGAAGRLREALALRRAPLSILHVLVQLTIRAAR